MPAYACITANSGHASFAGIICLSDMLQVHAAICCARMKSEAPMTIKFVGIGGFACQP